MRGVIEAIQARVALLLFCACLPPCVTLLHHGISAPIQISEALIQAAPGEAEITHATLRALLQRRPQGEAHAQLQLLDAPAQGGAAWLRATSSARDPRQALKAFLTWAQAKQLAARRANYAARQATLEAQRATLERALNTQEALYQATPTAARRAALAGLESSYARLQGEIIADGWAATTPSFQVILPPSAPSSAPIVEDLPARLLWSALLGLLAGLGLVAILEGLDPRLQEIDEAATRLGLPRLGDLEPDA
ncbi:hypothetical protein KKF91_19045 [Myxococcota bacterium]|nr:hypothetical protein [Myxococcota bacterium]